MRGSTGKKKVAFAGTALVLGGALLGGVTTGSATAVDGPAPGGTQTQAKLKPLNNSTAKGTSTVTVTGRRLQVSVDANRLLKGMPHAQHIHLGQRARNECPNVRDDKNADHRLSTAEGQPAYGPVRVSLTKRGDTSAKSTLAVNRFPKARERQINYDRSIRTTNRVARGISNGKAVVVVHGIDYNQNGKYDFAAGRSELDRTLPAEATDPVTCGVLRVQGLTGTP